MANKICESIRLLASNFLLFSAIVLTIWLPANLWINHQLFHAENLDIRSLYKLGPMIETGLGPICSGALIFALWQIKLGQQVSYREAMAVGFKKWVPLFKARFVAEILIILGLIGLIVPGIVLMVRYSLLAPAVVLEGRDVEGSRARSIELTKGQRWKILGAGLVTLLLTLASSELLNMASEAVPILWSSQAYRVVIDCISDILISLIQIVMFLFYWDAVQKPSLQEIEAATR